MDFFVAFLLHHPSPQLLVLLTLERDRHVDNVGCLLVCAGDHQVRLVPLGVSWNFLLDNLVAQVAGDCFCNSSEDVAVMLANEAHVVVAVVEHMAESLGVLVTSTIAGVCQGGFEMTLHHLHWEEVEAGLQTEAVLRERHVPTTWDPVVGHGVLPDCGESSALVLCLHQRLHVVLLAAILEKSVAVLPPSPGERVVVHGQRHLVSQ